jgi:hypothetical protein
VHFFAVPQRDADFFEILIRQIAQALASMRFSAKHWAYSPRPIDVSHSAMSFMQALTAHLVREIIY